MAKLVLNDIDSLANTASAKQALNENFTDIEAAIENTLSRDGTTPNQMQADIDMNSNDLLNANRVDAVEYFKNGVPFEQTVAYANKLFDIFSGTGAQIDFTMQTDPGSLGNLYVSVGGTDLKPGIDYNYNGTTLTFVVAPAAGTNNIYVRYDRALATEDSVLRQDLALTTTGKGAELVAFKQTGSGAVVRPLRNKLLDIAVSPEDFGAVGDGVTNDAAALALAMASGRVVDGNGRTYAVSGNLLPASGFKGLRNITLSQLTPSGSNRRTLLVVGLSDFVLDNVKVLRNGTGGEHSTITEMIENAGIYLSGCSDFTADYLEVSGGGVGTGIAAVSCSRFEMVHPYAHDMQYVLGASPGDDRIQGVWLDACSDFVIFQPTAWDLGGNFGAGATTRYSRGLTITGSSMGTVYAPNVNRVDQGVDLTGSVGNRFVKVIGGVVQNCYTWGYKGANSQRWVSIIGAVAEDCGFAGFVASGQTDVSQPQPHDIKFIDCVSHNAGSNGFWSASDVSGFLVQSSGAVDPSYPRGVKFINCRAVDSQTVKTMKYGFKNEVAQTGFADSNETIGCFSEGHTIAQASGFHSPAVKLLASTVLSVPNATYTPVDFASEDYDASAMHSTAGNIERVNIYESGFYLLQGQVQFDANATGRRGARFMRNGAAITASTNLLPAAPSGATTVPITTIASLLAGDTLRIEAFQDSGAALNTSVNGSVFTVTLLRKD